MKKTTETKHEDIPKDSSPEVIRRHFLKKFGKYAVGTPAVTFTLLSSLTSKAVASGSQDTGGGW